jgi:glutathione synthase/RimK-type ligase-like ATP-grasp enzyme
MKNRKQSRPIVLVGPSWDDHSTYLEDLLLARGRAGVTRIAINDLPSKGFRWAPMEGLVLGASEIAPGSAALVRRWGTADLKGFDSRYHAFVASECRDSLIGALEVLNLRWLTEPGAMVRAELKLVQLNAARQLGIEIPATLVTNLAEEAMRFAYRYKRVIAKAVRYALVTSEPTPTMAWTQEQSAHALEELEGSPIIIQELVEPIEHLRVVVVQDQAFAASVTSQSLDWRRDLDNHDRFNRVGEDLHRALGERAVKIARHLGLGLSSQDWIRSKAGRLIFLEANPAGQWLFLDPVFDGAISLAIADALESLTATRLDPEEMEAV